MAIVAPSPLLGGSRYGRRPSGPDVSRRVGGQAKAGRFTPHPPVFGRGVVIPTEQMEQSVRQEHRQLGHQIAAAGFALALRGRNTDDHITQNATGAFREFALSLSERKNVSRLILVSIKTVQFLDSCIAREK